MELSKINQKSKTDAVMLMLLNISQQRFTEVLRMESYLSNQLVEVNQKNFAHFRETLDAFIKMDKLEIFLFLDVETFDKISKMLRPVVCSKFDNDLRLAVILIFLTKGVSQNAIALWSGISQPSISRILRQGFDDICEKFGETIKWPTAEQIAYQQDLTKNKIPSFGQIDGKLWYVNRPPGTGTLNMSYKSRFAFNSLFVVDNEARIIYIQLSKNGCHSDGQMFNAGPISKLLEKKQNFPPPIKHHEHFICDSFLLGDGGFALTPQLLVPFRQTELNPEKDMFNKHLSNQRVLVENLFGRITQKFRLFNRPLDLDMTQNQLAVIAASVIYNSQFGEPGTLPILTTNHVAPRESGKLFRQRLHEKL
ncbi:unnamed protein product [Caenorhabditis angaria]|uniref:DDE Tnp4 domain-containing protein n=1 Tax=Caenorhabditis angaria TaxID=860376 RepID=A0A9P1NB72_9PELO|nr:unnamed protein product [Caenorhabditis angaria]